MKSSGPKGSELGSSALLNVPENDALGYKLQIIASFHRL